MTANIQSAINNLISVIKSESSDKAVSFRLFLNSQEVVTEISERYPDELKEQGISMRNLRGEFIK